MSQYRPPLRCALPPSLVVVALVASHFGGADPLSLSSSDAIPSKPSSAQISTNSPAVQTTAGPPLSAGDIPTTSAPVPVEGPAVSFGMCPIDEEAPTHGDATRSVSHSRDGNSYAGSQTGTISGESVQSAAPPEVDHEGTNAVFSAPPEESNNAPETSEAVMEPDKNEHNLSDHNLELPSAPKPSLPPSSFSAVAIMPSFAGRSQPSPTYYETPGSRIKSTQSVLRRLQFRINTIWMRPKTYLRRVFIAHVRVTDFGQIASINTEKSSGNTKFDEAAMDALYNAFPLQELPAGFQGGTLRVIWDKTVRVEML